MAVPMQADGAVRRGIQHLRRLRQRLFTHGLPACTHMGRHVCMRQQPLHRLVAHALGIEHTAVHKTALRTHYMQTCQKPAQPFQRVPFVQLRHAPTAPGADAEGKPAC